MALHSILPLVKRAFDAINDVSILSDKTGRNFLRAQLGSNFLGAYIECYPLPARQSERLRCVGRQKASRFSPLQLAPARDGLLICA